MISTTWLCFLAGGNSFMIEKTTLGNTCQNHARSAAVPVGKINMLLLNGLKSLAVRIASCSGAI
jgi:hypothetical protein